MFVELHFIQNFAPSNLNRDDTGSPKDCEFGGVRRARISSQAIKRAIRTAFRDCQLLPQANLAQRTKRIVDELAARMVAAGKPEAQARTVAAAALASVGLKLDDSGKTQYLLFLGDGEITGAADICLTFWDQLVAAAAEGTPAEETTSGRGRGRRAAKEDAAKQAPPEVRKVMEQLLDGRKAADLALFGRMLADLPSKNIDAAAQVAHAISTNRVSMEFDYYTAVDDLKADDMPGADMIGTVEFNSSCFYRYANVDLSQLSENLDGDAELVRATLEAFLKASRDAIPSGKQNSMAAQNPPSLMLAVVRERGLWSLANAFVRPVRPDQNGDLVENSVKALDDYWGKLAGVYGEDGIVGKWVATLETGRLDKDKLGAADVKTMDAVITSVLNAALPVAGERV